MKPLRPGKKWVLAAIGLLLALFILKIVLFLTAKPKITVDYVAEYNRTSHPQNYDPNDNAAPYYQKAFDAFVEMPDELRKPYINWPADFNDIEQDLLEKWLILNAQAFEYFKIAANKPYYWLERYTDEDNNMLSIMLPELSPLRYLTNALLWNAKLAASKDQSLTAFENILNCYRAGYHKCRTPSLLMEQLLGIRIKEDALSGALAIMDHVQIDPETLKGFQGALQAQFSKDTYILDFEAERMTLYDILQITFIDNGRGTGRLSWSVVKYFQTMCGREENLRLMCKLFLSCLVGPTRNEMVIRIEETFASFGVLKTETPWQLHTRDTNYFDRLDSAYCDYCDDFILDMFFPAPSQPFNKYHQVKIKGEALLTILAIHRFRAEKGMLPATLAELVSTGYLQSVPMDPYSDGLLVYKLIEDNFKLYSVGKDFSDDGGMIEVVNEAMQMPGFRGTSIIPGVRSLDIVYWPVEDLKKLRYEFTFEEAERLKAEKEAEAQRKIEEANQPK